MTEHIITSNMEIKGGAQGASWHKELVGKFDIPHTLSDVWLIDNDAWLKSPFLDQGSSHSLMESEGKELFTTRVVIDKPFELDVAASLNFDHMGEDSTGANRGRLRVEIIAENRSTLLEAWKKMRETYPIVEFIPEPPADDTTRIDFMYWAGMGGVEAISKMLRIEHWDNINDNYPGNVNKALSPLFEAESEDEISGKLLIWRGIPGTGKTHGILSLAKKWSDWCSSYYVTDPKVFFENPAYMMQFLLHYCDPEHCSLLILEDCGEMLSDSDEYNQGLASFLNLVDGMLGQGNRLLVMITTNKELNDLNPAVTRDGRAGAIVEFRHLEKQEANEWLSAHGSKKVLERSAPLSELYSIANKGKKKAKKAKASNGRKTKGMKIKPSFSLQDNMADIATFADALDMIDEYDPNPFS